MITVIKVLANHRQPGAGPVGWMAGVTRCGLKINGGGLLILGIEDYMVALKKPLDLALGIETNGMIFI